MKTIRILDDELRKRESFHHSISAAGASSGNDVGLIGPSEIAESFDAMLKRQNDLRSQGFWSTSTEVGMPLDDVDILIVDNELREFFNETRIFTSADEVAYMARCFSTCKLIVIVNRTTSNPFDLTGNFSYLGQYAAFSDIEIGQKQLSSKALWGVEKDEFHPWYWFDLPRWLSEFDARTLDAQTAIRENASILAFFGLEDVKEWLPRRILQTLGEGQDYSFGEFVRSSSFVLSPKDRAGLPTTGFAEETVRNLAPIVAARLWKWLEVQLLPELDILVDAPHLVARLPGLLTGDRADANTWTAVAVRHVRDVPNIVADCLEDWQFPKMHWLTRPAWYWRKVMNDERIPDVREPWNIEYVRFAFCEDTSRFVAEEEAEPYRAAVESPFGLRYVERLEGVDYQPPQRLAM